MGDEKAFIQSKMGTRLKFIFGPSQLTFSMRDHSGERQFLVNYENIDILAPTILTSNNYAYSRKLFAIPVLIFFISFGTAQYSNTLTNWLGVISAALVAAIYAGQLLKVFKITYTLFPMSPAPAGAGGHLLRIMMDRQHEGIVAELRSRWRRSLKLRYGGIDLKNDPAIEMARFSWMKENGIIDEAEHRAAMDVLRDGEPEAVSLPPRRAIN